MYLLDNETAKELTQEELKFYFNHCSETFSVAIFFEGEHGFCDQNWQFFNVVDFFQNVLKLSMDDFNKYIEILMLPEKDFIMYFSNEDSPFIAENCKIALFRNK